jgi:redox-sensitive bicupin YhaK (pirin superfamily)
VKYVNFRATKSGAFTGPQQGSNRATGSRHLMKPKQSFKTSVPAEGEQLLFVWKGAIRVTDAAGKTYDAAERDTVFIQGAVADLTVTATANNTELIQVQAPETK